MAILNVVSATIYTEHMQSSSGGTTSWGRPGFRRSTSSKSGYVNKTWNIKLGGPKVLSESSYQRVLDDGGFRDYYLATLPSDLGKFFLACKEEVPTVSYGKGKHFLKLIIYKGDPGETATAQGSLYAPGGSNGFDYNSSKHTSDYRGYYFNGSITNSPPTANFYCGSINSSISATYYSRNSSAGTGGSVSVSSTPLYHFSGEWSNATVTYTAIPNSGYRLKAWTFSGTYASYCTSSGATATIPSYAASEITATATFEQIQYHDITLSFNNGGRGTAPSSQTKTDVEVGTYATFSLSPMSATGYTFNGWTINGTLYTGSSVSLKDSATATGSWSPVKIPIYFQPDSHISRFWYRNNTSGTWIGPYSSETNVSLDYNSIVQVSAEAVEGYETDYTKSNPHQETVGYHIHGQFISIPSSIKKYNLTLSCDKGFGSFQYKINGASNWTTSTTNPLTVRPQYQSTWYANVTPRSGYTYDGGEKSGTVGTSDISQSFTTNAISYSRPLDAQFDGSTKSSQGTENVYYTFEVNSYFNDSAHTQSITSINVPTRDGYQFAGYYTGTNGSGTQVIDSTGKILSAFCSVAIYDSTTPVYAKWIPNNYTVKIRNGYSDIAYPDRAATFGTPLRIQPMPSISGGTRAHYTFAGWKVTSWLNTTYAKWGATSATCTTPITGADDVLFNGANGDIYVDGLTLVNGATVTLTAQWTRITYSVTIDNSSRKDDFDLSCSAEGSTYADGVLSFTANAGDSYSIALTFKRKSNAGTWIIPKSVNGYAFSRTNQGSALFATFSASHTFDDSESSSQSWSISTFTVSAVADNPRVSGVPVPVISFADDDETGRNVKIFAGTYEGVLFSEWQDIPTGVEHSSVSVNPLILYNLTDDASVTAHYEIARMDCNVAMDAKSMVPVSSLSPSEWVSVKQDASGSAWSHTTASVPYGGSVIYKFEKPTPSTAPGYEFAGWYDENDTLVSTSEIYRITSVTRNYSLRAKLKVVVTLNRGIDPGVSYTANLILNGTTYTGQACSTSAVIGSRVSIGVSLGEGAVFVNWYDSSDITYSDPKELAKDDSFEVADTTSLTARILGENQVYYVAIYCRNTTMEPPPHTQDPDNPWIDDRLGQISFSGDSLIAISRAEYAEKTETTPEGSGSHPSVGLFFEVSGTQIATLNIVNLSALDFLRVKRRKLSGTEEIEPLSRNTSIRTLVNQNYVYYVDFGYPTPSRIRIQPETLDDSEKGYVEMGSAAKNISGDGFYAEGTFEVGEQARVIAHPYNGWAFAGWYEEPPPSSGEDTRIPVSTDSYYDFTAPTTGDDTYVLYAKFEKDDGASLHKWEGSTERMLAKWRSKRYVLNKPSNLTSVRVDAESYPVFRLRLQSFSSPTGEARSEVDFGNDKTVVADQSMRRLPTRRPERYFQVEIQHDAEVDAIFLGTSGGELAV